jgi:hypothetical protein
MSFDTIPDRAGILDDADLCLLRLFARPNLTIGTELFFCAISASSAIFLILDLGHPFSGLITPPKRAAEQCTWVIGLIGHDKSARMVQIVSGHRPGLSQPARPRAISLTPSIQRTTICDDFVVAQLLISNERPE